MGNIQKLSTRIKKRPLFYDASYNQFYMYDELYLEAAEGPCHQNLHYVYKVVCYVTMPSFGTLLLPLYYITVKAIFGCRSPLYNIRECN